MGMKTSLVMGTLRALLRVLGFVARPLAVAVAFQLFCLPVRRSPLRANERGTMAKAQIEAVPIRGHQVRVYRWGTGERPVLMLHGWESRGSRFALLAERLLALGYSPITFDSPGHGDSEGDRTTILDYLEICRALHGRYGRFEAMVAHSFGVPCAFYALKQNVPAGCVVAVSGVSNFRYLLDTFCIQLNLLPAVKEGLRRRIEQLFMPLDDIWNRFSVTHAAEVVTQPVLVVHDRGDDVVGVEQGHLTADHFGARVQLRLTEGLGHNRLLRSSAVVDEICSFIHEAQRCDASSSVAAVAS